VGPRNRVFDSPDPMRRDILRGKGHARARPPTLPQNSAQTAKPIEMPFGMWARVNSRSHVSDLGPDPVLRRAILGERHARAYQTTFCRELKCLNRSRWCLACGLERAEGSTYYMGAHWR